MARGVKWICKGVKGFVSRKQYRAMSSKQRAKCHPLVSKGRPPPRRGIVDRVLGKLKAGK